MGTCVSDIIRYFDIENWVGFCCLKIYMFPILHYLKLVLGHDNLTMTQNKPGYLGIFFFMTSAQVFLHYSSMMT